MTNEEVLAAKALADPRSIIIPLCDDLLAARKRIEELEAMNHNLCDDTGLREP